MPKIKLPRKIRELAKEANAGSGDAAWDLYVHYRNGTGGVEKNDELERHWLERGAELGDLDAQEIFGLSHAQAGDYGPAREWFLKAAAQGSQTGEYNLGRLYEQGLGV
jgi:TPR repeat protein